MTFCTEARLPLAPGARDLVLGHCRREHEKRIRIDAMVAMPDRPITFTRSPSTLPLVER
jgi:hypothetical protein